MKTRAVSAILVAAGLLIPIACLLAVRVPATARRALSQPPVGAKALAIEIPELSYLRVRGGGSVHRIRLSTRNARDFARHSAVSLLVATFETRPALDRAEIAVEGTDCAFRTVRGAGFPNNGLLTFERGRGCERVAAVTAAELRLTVRFDNVARAAVWGDPPIEQDLDAGAIVVADRLASTATPRPMLRGAFIDVDRAKEWRRSQLLAYVWQISSSSRWIWIAVAGVAAFGGLAVFLLAGLRAEGPRLGLTTQAAAGGFCAAAALTLAYSVLVPPFQSADETHHFAGFADFIGRPELIGQAREWARLGHFARMQFRPEEHFTPAAVGVPYSGDGDFSVPDPSLRGAAIQWLWRAVPGTIRSRSAPPVLLTLHLIDAAIFSLAVAVFFAVLAATGEASRPELFAIPIFLVPTLPFFAMTVSNYGLLIAAYVIVAAGIVLDFRDVRSAPWAGPLIGVGWMGAALTARSAVPLAPFLLAWVAGRLVIGRDNARWRPALIYWIGVSVSLMVGIWVADRGYVRTTVGLGEQKLGGIFVRGTLLVLTHPWLLPVAGLAAAALERAISLRRRRPAAVPHAAFRRAALIAPVVMAAMLALSTVVDYPKLAFVDPFSPPPPAAYVKNVMAVTATMFRLTNLDFLTSWSFWGGFGWLETVPPAAFVSALVAASGLAFSGLVFLLARAGGLRPLLRVGLALVGAAVSMAAYALSVVIVTPADLHGRYLIGLYLCMLLLAWRAVPLFLDARPQRTAAVRAACVAAFVAVHAVSLAVILVRYF